MKYKRRILYIMIAVIFTAISMFACYDKGEKLSRFDCPCAVHYLDVGQGDCILINLPDGENMLIDAGPKSENVSDFIIDFIKDSGVERIDYFVLSHPQLDHVGNAVDIIQEFEVCNVFAPKLEDFRLSLFPTFDNFMQVATDMNLTIHVSDYGKAFSGKDYGVAFLSPQPYHFSMGEYAEFHKGQIPSEDQINGISSIIYLDLFGIRFLFTGDVPQSVENNIFTNSFINRKYYMEKGVNVNLMGIDFLKVAHHGSNNSSGEEFLSKIYPKNAIISVDGNNIYGHPSTDLLKRLYFNNPNLNLFRTDVCGSVSVKVDDGGNYRVLTDIDFN